MYQKQYYKNLNKEYKMIIVNFARIGQGKTLSMTRDAIKALNSGKVVYTNYHINWFGHYAPMGKFQKIFNKIYGNKYHKKYIKKQIQVVESLLIKLRTKLEYGRNHKNKYGIPLDKENKPFNYSKYWAWTYDREQQLKGLNKTLDSIENGYYRDIYYPPENLRKFKSFNELLNQKNILVLLDEAQNSLSSEHWKKIPMEVKRYITQSRKKGVDIYATVQRPATLLNDVRANSAFMWQVKKIDLFIFQIYIKRKYFADLKEDSLPDFENEKPAKTVWYIGSRWYKYYDTMQEVTTIEEYLK